MDYQDKKCYPSQRIITSQGDIIHYQIEKEGWITPYEHYKALTGKRKLRLFIHHIRYKITCKIPTITICIK